MTHTGPRPTRSERREEARVKARILREETQRRDRRRRLLLQVGVIAGSLGVVALVVIVIASSLRPVGPGPAAMPGGGFLLTAQTLPAEDTATLEPSGTVTLEPTGTASLEPTGTASPEPTGTAPVPITLYLDYQCPACRAFEATNGDYLAALVQSGAATLDIHPIAILDRASQGTRYSTRTANLMACVADTAPDRFWAVSRALFAAQPDEGTAGLDDDTLLDIARDAGVTGSDRFESCVRSETHSGWVGAQTKVVRASPVPGTDIMVTGTPTVIVDGVKYTGSVTDPQAFATFVVSEASQP